MANFVFTEFKRAVSEGEIDLNATDDIRVLLVMSNTTADTEEDADTIGGITTLDEYDGASYSSGGEALTGEVVNEDNANDRAEFDATDATFSTLGVGTRQAQAAIVYKWITSVSLSMPIAYIDTGGFPFDGNGGNVTIQWNTEGIVQFT